MRKINIFIIVLFYAVGLKLLSAEETAVQKGIDKDNNSVVSQEVKIETTAVQTTTASSNVPAQATNIVETKNNSLKIELKKDIPELKITTWEEDNLKLYPAFFVMAKRGDIKGLKFFLDKKLELNRQDDTGMNVLLESMKANQEKVVKFLLEKGANPKVVTTNGFCALRFAVDNKNKNLVKLFLKKEVDINQQDCIGQTPVMVAMTNGAYDIVKLLIKNLGRIDIDLQDKNGKTLLMLAVENKDMDLVKALIKRNVNIWVINSKNEDALSIAQKINYKPAIDLLNKEMKEERKNPKVEQWVRKPGSSI